MPAGLPAERAGNVQALQSALPLVCVLGSLSYRPLWWWPVVASGTTTKTPRAWMRGVGGDGVVMLI